MESRTGIELDLKSCLWVNKKTGWAYEVDAFCIDSTDSRKCDEIVLYHRSGYEGVMQAKDLNEFLLNFSKLENGPTKGLNNMKSIKIKTIGIETMTREELETAYKWLIRVNMRKTELIESLTGVKNDPVLKAAIESAGGAS